MIVVKYHINFLFTTCVNCLSVVLYDTVSSYNFHMQMWMKCRCKPWTMRETQLRGWLSHRCLEHQPSIIRLSTFQFIGHHIFYDLVDYSLWHKRDHLNLYPTVGNANGSFDISINQDYWNIVNMGLEETKIYEQCHW